MAGIHWRSDHVSSALLGEERRYAQDVGLKGVPPDIVNWT
jgi:hypothetical protein